MERKQRNKNLREYHKRHPRVTHAKLARIFKISRVRVTQLLKDDENLMPRSRASINKEGEGGQSPAV